MRIAIAPDAFKGSMSASRAAAEIAAGLQAANPGVDLLSIPMADGGEGTLEAIVAATGGRCTTHWVTDPLGRPVEASLGLTGDGGTGVVELAQASGLPLLTESERDPMRTTTRGTGELILKALDAGVGEIVVCIGGSATCDGGMGIGVALGVQFLDQEGMHILPVGGNAARVSSIRFARRDPRLNSLRIRVACDVASPLTGPDGAARVFAPQKGASSRDVELLDADLTVLGGLYSELAGCDMLCEPGAGAAGGAGAGLVALCGATLESGVALVADVVHLRERLRGCDLVITGEGCVDAQSAYGKTPFGVASVARSLGIRCLVLCGCRGGGWQRILDQGVEAVVACSPGPLPQDRLGRDGPGLLRVTASGLKI